jgi:acyl phosphate:glycerol-3-phosphate acyltransferase
MALKDPGMNYSVLIAVIVCSYLLGSIPFGYILVRVFQGVDVRDIGSGNIGATNVARTAGKGVGILTLFLDAAKGAIPILIGDRVLHLSSVWLCAVGLAAVVGHVLPIYLKLRGGKGVATALGVFLALSPASTGVAVAAFLVTFLVTKIVSLGSLIGAIVLTATSWFVDGRREVTVLAIVCTLIIVVRHQGNIRRMLERQEPQL